MITVFSAIEFPPSCKRQFEIIFPKIDDYRTALRISSLLREKETPIGAIDILIASICINHGAMLLTKDKDFIAVQRAVPEFQMKLV